MSNEEINSAFYEIERLNGLAIISDNFGFILEPDELLEIAHELIYTVQSCRNSINEFNKQRKNELRKVVKNV